MEQYEATFEIDSESDARAMERSLARLYDALREESRTVRDATGDSSGMLEAFEAIHDAASDPAPGTLTVTYERTGESFDE